MLMLLRNVYSLGLITYNFLGEEAGQIKVKKEARVWVSSCLNV